MSRWMRLGLLAVVAAGLAAVPACGPSAGKSGRPKIAVVTNCTDPFWDLCEAGANKAAKEEDVDLLFRQPEALDASKQMPIVDSFVEQGVNGLAISVINPKLQKKDLTRIAAEIPLITMDNDADKETGRLCYVGVDNKEAGKAVGRLVKQALPNGGVIAMFIGSDISANGAARSQGVLDELAGETDAKGTTATRTFNGKVVNGKEYGKYFLVDGEVKTDGGPEKNPQQYPEAMIGRLAGVPDVCMIGLYAYNPPAILSAVKAQSQVGKVKIVGFDENAVTLKAIAAGEIEGDGGPGPVQLRLPVGENPGRPGPRRPVEAPARGEGVGVPGGDQGRRPDPDYQRVGDQVPEGHRLRAGAQGPDGVGQEVVRCAEFGVETRTRVSSHPSKSLRP